MEKYIEIIKQLADKKGESINKVLTGCGINLSAYDTWKKGVAKPSMMTLVKLADYFDVTIDYLIGRNDFNTYLSKDEQMLIREYREMNQENLKLIRFQFDFLRDVQSKKGGKK